MLDPLGALVITFAVMSVISIVGVILLYCLKNEKLKKGIFYFLVAWGVVITYCNILGIPEEWLGEIARVCVLGALSIVALLVQLCMKSEKKFNISRVLVTISVIAGMVDCFLI